MSDKRYGVIPVQGNGFFCTGYTATILEDLLEEGEFSQISMDEVFGDSAITQQVICDLLNEVVDK